MLVGDSEFKAMMPGSKTGALNILAMAVRYQCCAHRGAAQQDIHGQGNVTVLVLDPPEDDPVLDPVNMAKARHPDIGPLTVSARST